MAERAPARRPRLHRGRLLGDHAGQTSSAPRPHRHPTDDQPDPLSGTSTGRTKRRKTEVLARLPQMGESGPAPGRGETGRHHPRALTAGPGPARARNRTSGVRAPPEPGLSTPQALRPSPSPSASSAPPSTGPPSRIPTREHLRRRRLENPAVPSPISSRSAPAGTRALTGGADQVRRCVLPGQTTCVGVAIPRSTPGTEGLPVASYRAPRPARVRRPWSGCCTTTTGPATRAGAGAA